MQKIGVCKPLDHCIPGGHFCSGFCNLCVGNASCIPPAIVGSELEELDLRFILQGVRGLEVGFQVYGIQGVGPWAIWATAFGLGSWRKSGLVLATI